MMARTSNTGSEEAAIAAFIRSKGVTRCPTACVTTTQASVPEADRVALERYVRAREHARQAKAAANGLLPFGPERADAGAPSPRRRR